jgi:signal transduction histidine kinase
VSAASVRTPASPVIRFAILVPSVAAGLYGLAAGRIADLELFLTVLCAAVLLAVVAAVRPWRGPRAPEAERAWQLLSATVGVGLAVPFLVAAVDVSVDRFSLLFALVVVAGIYTYPPRWRVPLSLWTLVAWGATLVLGGVDDPATLALHLGGGLLVLATSWRTSAALGALVDADAASRQEAELRAQLLASVLRTNSLEPDAVLDAVTDGLCGLGFDAVTVRAVDPELETLRLVAGAGLDDLHLPPEVPIERAGLSGVVVQTGEPIVVDDYPRHPAAIGRARHLAGVMAAPVGRAGEVRAVVAGGRREGQLTDVQREAMLLLAEQAGRALDRADAYERDRRTVEQLRSLDARVQDFVSTVSHELRTPLTVIQGLGHTLARRWDDLDDARRTDLFIRIDANAERLATMVRSLLDTSALDKGRLVPQTEIIDVHTTVRRLLHRLATVTAAHPVDVDVDEGLEVEVDPGLFEHVLENLLTNVAKHTPQGTRARVAATPGPTSVLVEVSDDGPGIPEDDLPFVLDRFFRGGDPTRRTSPGLGLGLALANDIVAAHGSELHAVSGAGRGTVFRFEVPRAAGG